MTREKYRYFIMLCSFLLSIPGWSMEASGQETRPDLAQGLKIFNVAVSASSFNPSRGETARLSYHLSQSAAVTVKVFDADFELVRVLAERAHREGGMSSEGWDGRDLDGKVVPNEAYLFTIEAEDPSGSKAVYDPVTFSGGEGFDISEAKFDRSAGTLTYVPDTVPG